MQVTVSSPPSRGRGLKRCHLGAAFCDRDVAPLTGAWIETCDRAATAGAIWSPPSRGRGLKPDYRAGRVHAHRCRPPHGGVD
mgnify:CR=1 FL=1